MDKDPVVIVSIARTPIGNLLGELKNFSSPELGAKTIGAVIERAHFPKEAVQEVLMGCVLPAGLGQAPARQAAIRAGLPSATCATTINKVCGSGMKTVMSACDALISQSTQIAIAGGMESMTNAPYLLLKARQGYRFGNQTTYDHMMLDGLEDAYAQGQPMGYFAEQCAKTFHFTREDQDKYAIISFERARNAIRNHAFVAEIVPLIEKTKTGERVIEQDERPFSVDPEKIPHLPPAFVKDGTVTAGNASAIADGAAALLLMRLSEAQKRGLSPLAKIVGYSSFAKEPSEFTTAPIDATRRLLEKINWSIAEVDLFEVNEAFAVVTLAFMQALQVPHDKVNLNGGACALGHPLGASGARILVTLIATLKQHHLRKGIATLCIGGGEATAIAVEMLSF